MIISLIEEKWQAQDTKLIPYKKCVSRLSLKFQDITFAYFPQAQNQFTDALATPTSMVKLAEGDDMQQLLVKAYSMPAYCLNIEECINVEAEIDKKPWYHEINTDIKNGEYLS